MDIPTVTTCQVTLSPATKDYQLPIILPILDHVSFQALPPLPSYRLLSSRRVFIPSLPLYPVRLQDEAPHGQLVPNAPVFWFRKRSFPCFQELEIMGSIVYLTQERWYLYRKPGISMKLIDNLWIFGYLLYTKEFSRRNIITLLRVLAVFNKAFDNCGVCEGKEVRPLAQ